MTNTVPNMKFLTEDQLGFLRAHDNNDLASLAAAEIDRLRSMSFVQSINDDGDEVIKVLESSVAGFYLMIYEDAYGNLDIKSRRFADLPETIRSQLSEERN